MAKSVTETALEHVRAKIAPLEATLAGLRIAEAALLDASEPAQSETKAKRTRGPNKKRGLAGGTLRQMGTADLSDAAEPNGNELENYAKPGRGAV